MRALNELSKGYYKDEKLYKVYTYINRKGEPTQEKQYIRIAGAKGDLLMTTEKANTAIHALASVGISAWAEEVK